MFDLGEQAEALGDGRVGSNTQQEISRTEAAPEGVADSVGSIQVEASKKADEASGGRVKQGNRYMFE